ncbi:ABC transporter substrate-binding protein [Micromonosporaceae bacterium B7E4]
MRRRNVLLRLALVGCVGLATAACGGSGDDGATGAGGANGRITVGGYNYKTLDPGGTGYISKSVPISLDIYGSLFDPPTSSDGDFVPDLATGYKYSDDLKTLTIELRQGVTFADGTPFDAEAVVYNFERYKQAESPNAQYFRQMSSATATGEHQVTMTFTEPTATMIAFLTYTPATLIGSPTAHKKAGQQQFGLKPVGAGPFEIVSHKPGEELVLKPFEKYWDRANVHLAEVKFINTSPEAQVSYQHVASGSIDSVQVSGVSTPPNVLDDAKANQKIATIAGENTLYAFLPINTYKPPFNRPEARQAINYCTDRDSIAKNVQRGWVTPAYVLAGADSLYYPDGGVDGAKAQFPYPYDPVKGKSLVDQLGGLEFTLLNIGGHSQVISNALAQQWQQCGIRAQVKAVQGPQLSEAYSDGTYQMAYAFSGGINDPQFYTSFQSPNTPQGKHGFAREHPEVPELIQSANRTVDPQVRKTTWRKVWTSMNDLAVDIPIISGPNYTFQNKCLADVDFAAVGAQFKSARLTC